MRSLPFRSLGILVAVLLLSGCFIRVIPTPGGVVGTKSGNHPDCGVGDACEDIPVVDQFFDEIFVATPDNGQEFVRWILAKNHMYGCTTDPEVRLYTTGLEDTPLAVYFERDDVFFLSALFRSTGPDIDYSTDFECNDRRGEVIGEGWVTYINVFDADGSSYIGGYFVGDTPNGQQIAAITRKQGGPDQGTQQLNVFSNYDSAFGNILQHDVGQVVEVNVYKEYRLTAANAGTYVFTFDARLPDEQALARPATGKAFVKVLDPNNDYQPFQPPKESNSRNLTTEWETRSLEITITDEMVGMLLQFGFTNVASNYDPTGVLYDNLDFGLKN